MGWAALVGQALLLTFEEDSQLTAGLSHAHPRRLGAGHGRCLPAPAPESAARLQVYDEHSELTADLLLTHFILSIPAEAWPSFATPLVSLRWLLHFELVAHVPAGSRGWLGSTPQPDRLSWTLPLLVVAPDS